MEGVEILNQFEVVSKEVFSWNNFGIGLIVGALIGLVLAVGFGISEQDWTAFFFALVLAVPLMSLFLGFLGGACFKKPVEYETHYEVTINEEVNMKEFMDKYEIIETRGSIYTVREK